jgi:hypothetical protein
MLSLAPLWVLPQSPLPRQEGGSVCVCLLFHNFQTNEAKVVEFEIIFLSIEN